MLDLQQFFSVPVLTPGRILSLTSQVVSNGFHSCDFAFLHIPFTNLVNYHVDTKGQRINKVTMSMRISNMLTTPSYIYWIQISH
jgi:hypothetical protein